MYCHKGGQTLTESFDTEGRDHEADTRKTPVKKHGRNSEIDEILDKAIRQGNLNKGVRMTGTQDQTDIPQGLSKKIMPLPYNCFQCGKVHVAYRLHCVLCGYPTPLGLINWRR